MRWGWIALLAGLGLATIATVWVNRPAEAPVPEITWLTRNDELRQATAARFARWLEERGLPPGRVRIEHATNDPRGTQKLIRAISGVGPDLLDLYGGESQLYAASGLLLDVTAHARAHGYGPDKTYAAIVTDILINGRQYGFPRSADVQMMWVNPTELARVGLAVPAPDWTLADFIASGRRYAELWSQAAGGAPGRHFFASNLDRDIMRRGLGLDKFNETMTASRLDDPRNIELYQTLSALQGGAARIVPTRAEQQAFAADISGAYLEFELLRRGNTPLIMRPSYALLFLRELGIRDFTVVPVPSAGFRNSIMDSSVVGVYRGTKQPELARRFLQFLASPAYNQLVIDFADGLPPVPQYATGETFSRPSGRPEEWGVRDRFVAAAQEHGIPHTVGPYIAFSTERRIEGDAFEAVLAGRSSAEQAARTAAAQINRQIAVAVSRDPELAARFAADQARQQRIDARLAAGEKVPRAWITNPFYQRYYAATGRLEESP